MLILTTILCDYEGQIKIDKKMYKVLSRMTVAACALFILHGDQWGLICVPISFYFSCKPQWSVK